MASNLLEGKVFVKISELDPTVGFAAEDEFVLVQNGVTLKTTGLDITDSVISIGNLANKPYVDGKIIDLIDGAPGILDTLDELATALNDDANFAGTITTIVNTKLASGDFGLRFWEELAQVNTYHIAEGINLYWTQERFDTALAAKNTFHIAEGSNLYFTEQRVLDVVTPLVPTSIFDLGVPEVGIPENIPGYLYYDGTDLSWRAPEELEGFSGDYNDLINAPSLTTDTITEGTNLYHTTARVRSAIGAGTNIEYNSSTGIVGVTSTPAFTTVTTTNLNVQNVTFTGTGAVTISSGNDLNLSAVGNVSINGETLSNVAFSGAYADLTGKPTLFGGSYNDLTNKPNIVEKTTGSWTLAAGANTVSLTVPINGTYSIWVNGNIPNGIVTYTATVVVTNTNVPVIGSSYGWYYADGNALVLTAIPTQVVGTANNISTSTVATTTANVFTFGITNNSGSDQVVNWGYTKL